MATEDYVGCFIRDKSGSFGAIRANISVINRRKNIYTKKPFVPKGKRKCNCYVRQKKPVHVKFWVEKINKIFVEKKFLEILVKNQNFGQKLKFWSKIEKTFLKI